MPRRHTSRVHRRAARLAAIKTDIAKHLTQCDLSVIAVAARHGITPRYVQMLFEPENTSFSKFVLEQRLARAHRLLTDARTSGWAIRTIAIEVGFNDVSYFNRAFRRHFGATPSNVRNAPQSRVAKRPPRRKSRGSKGSPPSL